MQPTTVAEPRTTEFILPDGLARTSPLLAMGAELKSGFCLQGRGLAHLTILDNDLEDADVFRAYHDRLEQGLGESAFVPERIAVDMHPNYLSTQMGERLAQRFGIGLTRVQHHHAHIAACLVEHGYPLGGPPVLGIALDGLGYGADGQLWGGEFLLAGYADFIRLGCFTPVPMPGGAQAVRQPWRNTLAHLHACGWQTISERFSGLDIIRFLQEKPLPVLHAMLEKGLNSPTASSAGRLFDAVAACLGIHRQSIAFEGQAAIELERLAASHDHGLDAYPFDIVTRPDGLMRLDWCPMWFALLQDIEAGVDAPAVAARFHATLIAATVDLARLLCRQHDMHAVVLCGGVFHNRLLRNGVRRGIADHGLEAMVAERSPLGDGGLALGQAAVCAARMLRGYANDG